jgi:hypothetical protein
VRKSDRIPWVFDRLYGKLFNLEISEVSKLDK